MQTALPVLLALTFPSERTATGTRPGSFSGVLEPENRVHVFTPLAIMFVTALANVAYFGPATTKCMREKEASRDAGWQEKP